MSEETYYVPVDMLQCFMQDVMTCLGVPASDAAIVADVLITSDLRGIESHGVGRLKYYYDRIKSGQHRPVTEFEVVRESPTTALVDGHHGMGHVVAYRSMKLAIEKARLYGMGSVAVRNSTHFGIAGYYPLMAVKENMVGWTVTNARPSIAPTFGVQPKLGTNPIAFGAPSDEPYPYLFDAATSITQRGKFEVLSRAEKPGHSGWVTGKNGEDITDPNVVLRGLGDDTAALLPLGGAGEDLGGHKGYGLATMVEILSASLQSGAFLHNLTGFDSDGKRRPFMVGHFFMAIRIDAFVDPAEFKHTTGEILRELRAAGKAPGQARILTAGQKEFEKEECVRRQGVAVNSNLQKEIKTMQAELGLSQYHFPF